VASGADVAQAETQLDTARAQLTDFEVARAQYEHAIAILTGRPPSELSIERRALNAPPPPIPVAVPSALLERRPDIANAERQMAAQNEQIGIAKAAFYPTIGIGGSVGLQGTSLLNVLSWPSRFWSLGPNASQLIYDAGRRRAILQQQQDLFDASVAVYRQTVLNAFQQVEDALSALRILERESAQVKQAVDGAQRSLDISTAQYKAGVVSYLQVMTAQTFLLQNQRTAVDLLARRLAASVQLVEALGGGWNASRLPSVESLKSRSH
jgi:NodT family efflux transporter outer membrane factor (OMF) lipoprotein